jgi:FlaA1/EpsC-like NDP-sugar epimerase
MLENIRKVDRWILSYITILVLTFITFSWTFWIFHRNFEIKVVLVAIVARILASTFIFRDYTLSWSKATAQTFLIKSIVNIVAFLLYMPIFYGDIHIYFFLSELFTYLFVINFLMYSYRYYINKSSVKKDKIAVIYGAGRAGLKLEEELRYSNYKVKCFIDDNRILNGRSIDGIPIYSKDNFLEKIKDNKLDLLVIAMPSAKRERIEDTYSKLHTYFEKIQILPSFNNILQDKPYSKQLKDISVEDLLARRPKDLDKEQIANFIKNKTILITGAGGSIGSEISRQCVKYGAKELILVDHSEYNLYKIEQELNNFNIKSIMQSVVNKDLLNKTFQKYKPQIVIHAAAYKHVPMCEENIEEAILNNIIGTKNTIDLACKYEAEKFVLISTDKAVRPTSVMGATKRVCELYAQNIKCKTEIVAVRFGNVLGSSGSVIPKFKEQIKKGGPITVTHPDITRYFMLIPEACELVLQAASIGKGGEIFILDMGEPIKIVDLAKKMCELSGRDDIEIKFTGLRPGEKLYEELLIDDSEQKTKYESIMVGKVTYYDIEELKNNINKLLISSNKLTIIKKIVPEFNHNIGGIDNE